VDRLKAYRSRLVVFPRKQGKPKAGDATVSVLPVSELLKIRLALPYLL
jgi:large subunit ribosomal protein L13e